MKNCFSILILLFLSIDVFGQETFAEMNDRATSTITNTEVYQQKQNKYLFPAEHVIYVKNQSLYRSGSDRITQNLLLDSGDKDIIRLVKKAKKNRKREYVAFASIPLGIMAAACIRQNQLNSVLIKPVGISFLAASLSCIIVSPIACQRKTTNYRKAVRLYNERF